MSESIGEMILPGTYIDVRAEGLIGVGGISTGNIGIVGTANRGPLNTVQIIGSYTEALDIFGQYDAWTTTGTPLSLTRSLEQVFKGGGSTVYAVRVANGTPVSRSFIMADGADAVLFALTATSGGTWATGITATLTGDELELAYQGNKEVFQGATAKEMLDAINQGSQLVAASGLVEANEEAVVVAVLDDVAGSNDGANATVTQLSTGLGVLATQAINIVVAAGFGTEQAAGTMLAHLEATENDGLERIAVMGVTSDNVADVLNDDVQAVSNKRVVLVGPGLQANDARTSLQVDLPGSYSAALVAGRLSTLAPHISLTNKDVAADGLTTDYTRAQQKQLLQSRVMVLHRKFGIRALKGISTDTGAFKQISVRRIVDFAKAGVRKGSNPYIGKLNNVRVRGALKATLDGFLASMVLDEMLTEYQLDVTATRAQEINGIALVTLTLKPTFSIDFVKVIMNLE
ncbi:MAG: hypothetical protein ACI97K_001769 [Glaciecola sp.]|jgi:hypothetical protein